MEVHLLLPKIKSVAEYVLLFAMNIHEKLEKVYYLLASFKLDSEFLFFKIELANNG